MAKHLRKQSEALASRIRYREEVISKCFEDKVATRVRTGGFKYPGSMNKHKGNALRATGKK